MTRDKAERRKLDFSHAIKKKRKSEYHTCNKIYPWYDNLHAYSKNKIHCSCPNCSDKTSKNGYTNTDKKKLLNLEEQLNEEE